MLSAVVRGVEGNSLVMALDLQGLAASTGSACESGSTEVSHVLSAMGFPEDEARGALRLSLGHTTTDADVDAAIRILSAVVAAQRSGAEALRARGERITGPAIVFAGSGAASDASAVEAPSPAAERGPSSAASSAVERRGEPA